MWKWLNDLITYNNYILTVTGIFYIINRIKTFVEKQMEHFKWLVFSKGLDKYVDYMKLKAISFTNANNFSVSAWTPSKTIENEWN